MRCSARVVLMLAGLLALLTPGTARADLGAELSTPTPIPVAAASAAVAAHELGQGYFFFRVYEDSLVVRIELTTEDVNQALGFGWDLDAGVELSDVRTVLDSIRGYVEPKMLVEVEGEALELNFQSFDVRFLEVADFVQLYYTIPDTTGIPDEISVTFPALFETDALHRNFLIVEHNWKTGTFNSEAIVGIFSPNEPTQTLDLSNSNALRGFIAMIKQGVWHIWIGLDHILFLVALILPAVLKREDGEWKPVESFKKALYNIIGIVTFFTLAHSVTLSLAALEIVSLPSKWVEAIIAGSIAVAAWANLVPKLSIKEGAIAFAFGLFHGFGFASVLGDIGLGREHLVLSLLGFNIGVEIGQIAIIAAIFPVLFLLRKSPIYMWLLRIGSLGLIAIALLWVFERVFEFNVPVGPIVRSLVGLG